MRFIAGPLNGELLENLLSEAIESCTRVRAAIAYASRDNLTLFDACERYRKPLEFYGRYDHTVAIDPPVLKWFLDRKGLNSECKLVPDILHSKVIWWVDHGVYVGSANLSDRAWKSNIEAGTFLSQDELVEAGMEQELLHFFEQVDERSYNLTAEIYEEQVALSKRRREAEKAVYALEKHFDKKRLVPTNGGLVFVSEKDATKRFQKFARDWNKTLQVMRTVANRVAAPDIKPHWIDPTVPAGVQADQFLHAYYYKQVKDGNKHPYEEFFERNSKDPDQALQDALEWWHESDFDHEHEDRTMHEWAPRLRELLARDRILHLNRNEFIDVVSRVHAMRDHAVKQPNKYLGLPDRPQSGSDKLLKFGEMLWERRSQGGKSALDLLNYVIWGHGTVPERIWKTNIDKNWAIPHIGVSSLGEVIGRARPDEYPPRNMRTSKGLVALGHRVQIGM